MSDNEQIVEKPAENLTREEELLPSLDMDKSEMRDRPMRAKSPVLSTEELEKTEEKISSDSDDAEEQSLMESLISKSTIKKLWSQIDQVENRVQQEINHLQTGKKLIGQLTEAKRMILKGVDQFDESSGLVSDVEYYLNYINRVRVTSKRIGIPLLIYEVIWIIVLISLIFLVNVRVNISLIDNQFSFININILINSMIWGGFGGIVGALYALWKHIAKDQDFDSQYSLWYITNPILGVALGGFVYLLIQAGFLSLTAGGGEGESIQSAAVIYVFAWISGFKQNVVYELVRRVLDVFRVDKQAAEVAEETKSDSDSERDLSSEF